MVDRDVERLRELVRAVLEERFDDVEFVAINVHPDVDDDGMEYLEIAIVFDSQRTSLDARKTSGLVRHLRPRLAEVGETAFPILSFIAKSDLGNTSPEAA